MDRDSVEVVSAVESIAEEKIRGMKDKANHNKSEALWSFKTVMLSTLLSPLFVAFGEGLVYGKIIPAILSVIAAAFTAWIQLRKPQSLWATYRTAQRKMEVELDSYRFKLQGYDEDGCEPDKVLITRINDIYLETHFKWSDLVPTTQELKNINNTGGKSAKKK